MLFIRMLFVALAVGEAVKAGALLDQVLPISALEGALGPFAPNSLQVEIGGLRVAAPALESVYLQSVNLEFTLTGDLQLHNLRLFVGSLQFGDTHDANVPGANAWYSAQFTRHHVVSGPPINIVLLADVMGNSGTLNVSVPGPSNDRGAIFALGATGNRYSGPLDQILGPVYQVGPVSSQTPEPATALTLLVGAVAIAYKRRR